MATLSTFISKIVCKTGSIKISKKNMAKRAKEDKKTQNIGLSYVIYGLYKKIN